MRVVQIEPGTDADFDAVRAVIEQRLCRPPVAMLPPITSTCGKLFLTHFTRSSTPCE